MAKKRLTKNQKKWFEALRGGKYRQGRYRLRRGNEYCCLGVACDLYAKDKGDKWVKVNLIKRTFRFLKETHVLPRKVKEWFGLNSTAGLFKNGLTLDGVYETTLINVNDTTECSFPQIADLIDNNREKVFK